MLLGVPGLAVGMVLGRVVRSWKALALVFAIGAAAFALGFDRLPDDDSEEDDDPTLVVALALLTNLVTYPVGLVLGKVARR